MTESSNNKNKSEMENKSNSIKMPSELNKDKYELKISYKEDIITFEFHYLEQIPRINYIKMMNLNEIKEINIKFSLFETCIDFFDYLKLLSKDKKINFKKSKDKITIILFIDAFYKKEEINIDLIPERKYFELKMNKKNEEINDLKSKIDFYIKENNKLMENLKNQINESSKENEELKEQNKKINLKYKSNKYNFKIAFSFDKCLLFTIIIILLLLFILSIMFYYLKKDKIELNNKLEKINRKVNDILLKKYSEFDQSLIMNYDEKDMIIKEIQDKTNKRIREIKKLYQATKDGSNPKDFHSKCDNIPNTLVLIKSEGNRRFGGFTPISWKSKGGYVIDNENKTFVFSLDNKKMHFLKNKNEKAVYHDEKYGPCFGFLDEIAIKGNSIKEKILVTIQFYFYYKEDKQALSEYNTNNPIKALEYEVFHIIFY